MPARQNETLGFILSDLYRLYRKHFETELLNSGLDLTPGAARALAYSFVYDGLRQKELAERMAVEPMTLVAYLDQLELKGLIERVPDRRDRRCKIIRVKPEAVATIQSIRQTGARVRAIASEGMDADQAENLRLTLLDMRDRLAAASLSIHSRPSPDALPAAGKQPVLEGQE